MVAITIGDQGRQKKYIFTNKGAISGQKQAFCVFSARFECLYLIKLFERGGP